MSGLTKLQLLKLRSLPWWDQIKRKERWSPAEHVQTAERLAKEHGILPRPSWLCKNGFSALDAYMRKYPELFAHIPQQESLYSLADQHVQTAEWLAKEHNGVRPSLKWLLKNGFSALASCIRRRPELFVHIPTKKWGRSPAEHVQTAERLATEHGGLLNYQWLRNNGYSSLYAYMRRHPEMFSHIPQTQKGKKSSSSEHVKGKKSSSSEHVQTAERLVKEHNGILPNPNRLCKNGFRALSRCLYNYPELFSHIPQAKNIQDIKSFEEARDLAQSQGFNSHKEYRRWAKNIAGMPVAADTVYKDTGWTSWGDFLGTGNMRPPSHWLPFAEAKAKHVHTAERLAAEHGILPNRQWLRRSKHHDMYNFMNEHPELFAHIPRHESKFKTHADCHPDRPHQAHGLCKSCYGRKQHEQKRKRAPVAPERPPVFERDELEAYEGTMC